MFVEYFLVYFCDFMFVLVFCSYLEENGINELKRSKNGRKWPICEEVKENQGNLVDWFARTGRSELQRLRAAALDTGVVALVIEKLAEFFLLRLGRLWETCQNV